MAHESLKAAYEKDAKRTEKPYLLWQVRVGGKWESLNNHPAWVPTLHYRRHPHADLILTYDPNTVYEFQAADKSWHPWQTVFNPPLWDDKLNYRKKPMEPMEPMEHETLRAQYEKDRTIYNEPHLLWEFSRSGPWETLTRDPSWNPDLRYRRKPEARPHAHLIKLWADGGEIQKFYVNRWFACQNPCWEYSSQYRQKPTTQTRFIPIFRMPSASVYVGEGKITLADCNSINHDTVISTLEITVDSDNNVTLVKEHKCDR